MEKSFDLQEINEFDFSFSVVSRFVPKLRKFKKIGARNIFLTDGTLCTVSASKVEDGLDHRGGNIFF